jgi:AcrR family transcriptional regulator
LAQLANGRRRGPTGRPPIISLEAIVAAATTVAERVGLDSLTMNMVADELGVTSTALYHYLPSKQALIDLVVDAAFNSIEAPPRDVGPWDERLRLFEGAVRDKLRRLPRIGSELSGGNPARPAVRRLFDIGVEIVSEAGADELEMRLAFTTVYAYMIGQLLFDGVYTGGRTTELEAIQAATGRVMFTSDDLFDYGIDVVLTGLRAQLAVTHPTRRSRRTASATRRR